MGKTLFELAKQAQPDYPHQIILAKVDGKLHELKDMEIENEKVEYITTAGALTGKRKNIYHRPLPLATKPIGEV